MKSIILLLVTKHHLNEYLSDILSETSPAVLENALKCINIMCHRELGEPGQKIIRADFVSYEGIESLRQISTLNEDINEMTSYLIDTYFGDLEDCPENWSTQSNQSPTEKVIPDESEINANVQLFVI